MDLLPQIAFGYGRVSTAKQGLSREAQTETVARASEYHTGAAAHEMFFDEDTSGGIPFAERPSGRLLLIAVKAALAAGGSPTIIVTKVDRLGRDTVDVSQTVTLFESLGARIVFLDINVDTRTAKQLADSRKCVGGGGSEFVKLTTAEQAAVLTAMNKVGGADALLQITSQWLAAKPTTTKTVQAVVDECIEAKRKACRREHYLATLRCSLDNFARSVSKLVHEVTTRDVETWMKETSPGVIQPA